MYELIVESMFSRVSIAQLYHLLSYFQPSKMAPSPVSSTILSAVGNWRGKNLTLEEMTTLEGLEPSL